MYMMEIMPDVVDWIRVTLTAGCCEYGNEPYVPIKAGKLD